MIPFLDCPECNLPCEITHQYYSKKNVECADLLCLNGHTFSATADWLIEQGLDYTSLAERITNQEYFFQSMDVTVIKTQDDFQDWLRKMMKRIHGIDDE